MVSSEVLQERLGALTLRRRKVCGETGFVHLSKQIEKAATELSVELVGRRPVVLVRLLQRRRALLGGPAEPSGQSRVTRARGAARVRARNRHEHLPIRKRLARRLHATMPVPPRRCRFVRVARIGRRRLGRSERLGLAEETDRPQLALRAVAQREVLLPKQAQYLLVDGPLDAKRAPPSRRARFPLTTRCDTAQRPGFIAPLRFGNVPGGSAHAWVASG